MSFRYVVILSVFMATAAFGDLINESVLPSNQSRTQTTKKSMFEMPIQAMLESVARNTYHNRCRNFVADDGSFGENGLAVVHAIDQHDDLKFLASSQVANGDLLTLCPGLSKMDPSQKKAFWVWSLGQLAFYETACGKTIEGRRSEQIQKRFRQRPNPKEPEGLFYLGHQRRKAGPLCDRPVTDDVPSIECVLKLVRDQLAGDEKRELFSRQSWSFALRPSLIAKPKAAAAQLKNGIQAFPLCKTE